MILVESDEWRAVKSRAAFPKLAALYVIPLKTAHAAGYKVILEGNFITERGADICQFIEAVPGYRRKLSGGVALSFIELAGIR